MDDKLASPLPVTEERAYIPVPDALPQIADYYKWSVEQARHIREGRFDLVDKSNVADEIEDLSKRERKSVVSGLEQILTHILKWDHQPKRRSRSWDLSIFEHRKRVTDDLKESPSLDAQRSVLTASAYSYARVHAAKQTKLPLRTFPETCPYSWEQIMDAPYELEQD